MEEESLGVKYVFDSGRLLKRGRLLKQSPEGQPLSELLHDFSKKVLEVLDKDKLVIVGGESGLGKTEIFLGRKSMIKAGGLVDILSQESRTFQVVDAQSGKYARRELEEILKDDQNKKPEVVLVDESGVMTYSEEIKFDIIRKLLDDGRKVVLVGGGRARASEQNAFIKEGLNRFGVDVNSRQMFEFPSFTLNSLQSEQVLRTLYPDMTKETAGEIIDFLDKQGVPKIFRVLLNCSSEAEFNTRERNSNFIRHIKIQPN